MRFQIHNIGLPGLIVVMFAILIAAQGMALVIISLQNFDLKNFFVLFNQSVVESRQQNNISNTFRALQLADIQELQNSAKADRQMMIDTLNNILQIVNNATGTNNRR